jgi:hypothetical protein
MGQGNVCTFNECEGVFYLDFDLLHVYRKVIRCACCNQVKNFDPQEESQTARELSQRNLSYSFDDPHTDWHFDQLDR